MLTQKLQTNEERNDGVITITCAPGGLAELLGLAEELALRSNVETAGQLHVLNDPGGNYGGTPSVPEIG